MHRKVRTSTRIWRHNFSPHRAVENAFNPPVPISWLLEMPLVRKGVNSNYGKRADNRRHQKEVSVDAREGLLSRIWGGSYPTPKH